MTIRLERGQTDARMRIEASVPFRDLDPDRRSREIYNQVSHVLAAQIELLAHIDPHAVRDTLDFALRDLGAGTPDVALDEQMARVEAEWWARMATPSEITRYAEAALRNIPEKTLHPGLLRRVLANIWRRLEPIDRRRFLERVAEEKKSRAGQA